MKPLLFKDMTRDERRKCFNALGEDAPGRAYYRDERTDQIVITATDKNGTAKMVQLGEDPNADQVTP